MKKMLDFAITNPLENRVEKQEEEMLLLSQRNSDAIRMIANLDSREVHHFGELLDTLKIVNKNIKILYGMIIGLSIAVVLLAASEFFL